MDEHRQSGAAFLLALLISGAALRTSWAGDSFYGKVTEVRSADVVILNFGQDNRIIRIIGIVVPRGPIANEARQFVTRLALGKNARVRLGWLAENGELVGRLVTDDPVTGGHEVGLELVRRGLAQRSQGEDHQFGYKYGELSRAEKEAREAKRGLWSTTAPR